MEHKIAITGMSGLFPGAKDYNEFWDNLCNGLVSYHTYIDEEGQVRSKGKCPDSETFDAQRYRLSERDAMVMDPQIRKFIELIDSALIDGEYLDREMLGSVAVIATQGSNHTYHDQLQINIAKGLNEPPNDLLLNFNKGTDFMATRAAHIFNFQGPCFNLQSACSSSLIAIVEACWMLQTKRCDTVICGGVHISYPLEVGYKYEPGSIYSKTGVCRPFEHSADGTVPSDGGGVVILRRLQDAENNGDNIHAVISNALSNNDGANKTSYAAPSVNGQYQLLDQVYCSSAINPSNLQFIECHATGTIIGDPLEVQAISQLMESYGVDHALSPVVVGSVKGNIGHLFWASGIASLIKSVLSLKHGIYPGTSNLVQLNELLSDMARHNLLYTSDNIPLDPDKPAIAAISSMGVGGTNAHLIIEGYGNGYSMNPKQTDSKRTQNSIYSFFTQTEISNDFSHVNRQVDKEGSAQQIVLTKSSLLPYVLSFYEQVLGESEVSPDSDYFDLYGDSITAVELISLFKSELGIEVTSETIYEYSTPEALSSAIVTAQSSKTAQEADSQEVIISACHVGLLSPFQQRFYLLEKLQRCVGSQYNVPLCFEIPKNFPVERLRQTLHEILKQLPQFNQQYKITRQGIMLANKREQLIETTWTELAQKMSLEASLKAVFEQRFDLENGPLCRVTTLTCNEQIFLILNFHHITIDGMGLYNLLNVLSAAVEGSSVLNRRYIPQQAALDILDSSRSFWRDTLSHVPRTALPNASDTLAYSKGFVPGYLVSHLSSDLVVRVQNVARSHRVSPFVVYYALFNATLANFLDTSIVCTGTTLANRTKSDRETIDCRINNIPVLVNCGAGQIRTILNETDRVLKNCMPHAYVPLDMISSLAASQGQGLYDILFMSQNQTKGNILKYQEFSIPEYATRYQPVYCNLTVNLVPERKGLTIETTFNQANYSTKIVESFMLMFLSSIDSYLPNLERQD